MDRVFESFGAFTHFLEKTAESFTLPYEAATVAISHVLDRNVKKVFGDRDRLAELADATQEERTSLGYSADEPLLRDGSLLRNSMERTAEGLTAAVGSSEPIQGYHETGYVNARTGKAVPPRPVYEIGLKDSEADVIAILGAANEVAMGGSTAAILDMARKITG